LTCGPELAPFFSVVAAGLVVMGSGMGVNSILFHSEKH
jgi:hypothetical protein